MTNTTQQFDKSGELNSLTQTIIPELTDANYANSVEFLGAYTTYLDLIQSFTDDVDRCIRYNAALNSSEFVLNSVDIFSEVNASASKIDNQFLLFWLSKYSRCVGTIKDLVIEQEGTDSIYGLLSDSIGLMTNTLYMLTDSVIPYNDLSSTSYPAPLTYPVSLANKIRPNSLAIAERLSKTTSAMLRQNIINIQFQYATSNEAHGSNLITDIAAYSLARGYTTEILNQIKIDFKTLFKLVGYFCNISDHTGYNPADYTLNQAALIGNVQFTTIVQGDAILVDLLGKRIRDTRKALLNADLLVAS